MGFDAGRGLTGFFILLFFLIAYNRIATPEFFEIVGISGNLSKEDIRYYATFLQPLMFAVILAITAAIIFPGTGLPEAAMLGFVGVIAYLTFTSQWFYSIMGMGSLEQKNISGIINYLAPIIISGIMMGVAFVAMKVRGN